MREFRGQIKGFPEEVVMKMGTRQVEQGNAFDVSVFERWVTAGKSDGGFTWSDTEEGGDFWCDVIGNRNFGLFFKRYPRRNGAGMLNYQKWE